MFKKGLFFLLLSLMPLFANSALDMAFESFGVEGGREKNVVLYSAVGDDESGKNQKAFLKKTVLKNKKNYLIAKRVLTEKGVPSSFVWIAMTESKFDNSVKLKRTKTAGIWQMVPATSKKFGLKVGKGVDERLDVEKCTAAFADYCNYMYKKFKNWGVVAVAYNCGDGKMRRVIRKVGSSDLNLLLDPNKRYLPKETRSYFFRTVSLARSANDPEIAEFLRELEEAEYVQN